MHKKEREKKRKQEKLILALWGWSNGCWSRGRAIRTIIGNGGPPKILNHFISY